jgi:hypothetical protein
VIDSARQVGSHFIVKLTRYRIRKQTPHTWVPINLSGSQQMPAPGSVNIGRLQSNAYTGTLEQFIHGRGIAATFDKTNEPDIQLLPWIDPFSCWLESETMQLTNE